MSGASVGIVSKEQARREFAAGIRALADLIEADEVAELDIEYRLKNGQRFGYRSRVKGVDKPPLPPGVQEL